MSWNGATGGFGQHVQAKRPASNSEATRLSRLTLLDLTDDRAYEVADDAKRVLYEGDDATYIRVRKIATPPWAKQTDWIVGSKDGEVVVSSSVASSEYQTTMAGSFLRLYLL